MLTGMTRQAFGVGMSGIDRLVCRAPLTRKSLRDDDPRPVCIAVRTGESSRLPHRGANARASIVDDDLHKVAQGIFERFPRRLAALGRAAALSRKRVAIRRTPRLIARMIKRIGRAEFPGSSTSSREGPAVRAVDDKLLTPGMRRAWMVDVRCARSPDRGVNVLCLR